MNIDEKKNKFLRYELGLLSLKAALSTRNNQFPIYNLSIKLHQRAEIKRDFRSYLAQIEQKYASEISEQAHIEFIKTLSDSLSQKHGESFYEGRFRIGISQKLVNVHLKYLWAAGLCPEPLHCPIDGIVRDIAAIDYNWISSDSIDEYTKAIEQLKLIAQHKNQSLAEWELEAFKRRDQ